MSVVLQGISSMAPRRVLAVLAERWCVRGDGALHVESMGGVDAARRIQAGDGAFDVVFLASEAIDRLMAAGVVVPGSKVDLMRSSTGVAVRAGADVPDIGTEQALRDAVATAPAIACSTGPSGVAIRALLARWGLADGGPRIVQAAPGVPVASLLASGEVALGFQQASELIHAPGIAMVGPLPAQIAIDTVFSAAVVSGSPHTDAVTRLLAFMASDEADDAKCAEGMLPAAADASTTSQRNRA